MNNFGDHSLLNRALITGGSGFIGSVLAERLKRAGWETRNLDVLAQSSELYNSSIKGDVRDPDALRKAVVGCSHVFHLAAAHHDFGISKKTYFDVNEQGAMELCDACDAEDVRTIVFTSSVAVYGDGSGKHHEGDETKPINDYGASKLRAEHVFRKWVSKGNGRNVLVIRPSVVFGPRNFANMYALIDQIARNRFVQVGASTNIKSMVYVDNLVDAMLFLVQRTERAAFDVYNVADKPDLTSSEIAATIYRALGRTKPSLRIPLGLALMLALPFDVATRMTGKDLGVSSARVRKLAVDHTQFPCDKLLAAGFTASKSLEQGISQMVKWYCDEGKRIGRIRNLPPVAPLRPAVNV